MFNFLLQFQETISPEKSISPYNFVAFGGEMFASFKDLRENLCAKGPPYM